MFLSLISVLIPLLALIYLAYRGASVLILGPVLALVAVVLSGAMPILATYTQIFMPAAGHFIVLYFPLFLLGAIFGKLMDDSGAALSIARNIINKLGSARAILAVVLACAILTYGGVSLFVVAFAVYPIAAALFKEADIPKRLIPATIALGAFTFTMTALPGTPAIQNAIPMPYFGTTAFAAPGLGILAALIMFGCGQVWLERQMRRARQNNQGYGSHNNNNNNGEVGTSDNTSGNSDAKIRTLSHSEGFDLAEIQTKECPDTRPQTQAHTAHFDKNGQSTPPQDSFALAILPIVLVVFLNYIFSAHIFSMMDTSYLAEDRFGNISLENVRGVWSIICALTIGCILILFLYRQRFGNIVRTINSGADAAVLPIFNTASLVGFGSVIAALPAFILIQHGVESLGGNPLVSLALSVNILAGVTGSASGGMSIALQTLGDTYLEMARAKDIDPALLHRITTIATGGLDSLPHNGAVVTLLSICGLTHRQAYKDLFFVAVLFPILALISIIILGSLFGAF